MRKKWTYVAIVSMMLGVAPVFTGCVDTDEPAGIENLRGAKAELLKAKAELELAKIELVKAQAAHELANANRQQADADYRKAEEEYYRANTEHQKQMWAEKLKEEQARVEAAIMQFQAAQAAAELQMVNSQKAIAIAKASLTEQEYNSLYLYKLAVNTAKGKVDYLNGLEAEAAAELIDAMSSWEDKKDAEEEKLWLQHRLEHAESRRDMAQQAYEDAQKWAVLPEDVKGLQERYDELQQKEDELLIEEKELELEKAEWESQSEAAIAFKDANFAWNQATEKKVKLEAYSYDADLSVLDIPKNMTIKDDEVEDSYKNYYQEPKSPDDSWLIKTSDAGEYIAKLENNIQFFESLKLDKNGEAWNEIRVNQAKDDVKTKEDDFKDESDSWQNAIDGFNDGVTAKPEVLDEAKAVSTALTAYNTAVDKYAEALKAEGTALAAAQKVLDDTEFEDLDATIQAQNDIIKAPGSTNTQVAAATAKRDAAQEYKDAIEAREDAEDVLINGYYDKAGKWVNGAYTEAESKFYEYKTEYNVDDAQWDAVSTAYNNGNSSKKVTAEQIADVIAVTCDQIEKVIEKRSKELFGEAFGSRLVAVTGDELAAEIQEILADYNSDDYYVKPTSNLVYWDLDSSDDYDGYYPVSDLTDVHIKYFLLGGFELYWYDRYSWNYYKITTYDFNTIGALEQAKSNVIRGEAFASGNAAAVDAAVKYLTEVLDKATGEKGVLTLNNAEVKELEAKKDEAEAAKEAAFEATGLAEKIRKNSDAQGSYGALIASVKALIEEILSDALEGSSIDGKIGDLVPDWDALQKALDAQVMMAKHLVEWRQLRVDRLQEALDTFGNEEYDRYQQAKEEYDAIVNELNAANTELTNAVDALNEIIQSILASVQ